MTYFEKMKHLEPNMSKAFKEFAKMLYNEVKEGGSVSIERSANNTSAGLIDGISIVSHGF
jgi:DNA-binding protein YbaB